VSMSMTGDHIIAAMRRVVPLGSVRAALHEPLIGGAAWAYVKDCLDTGWVSSAGAYVDRFEESLAAFTGIPNVVAVVNGTAALHMCLLAAGVRAGDEVLVPTLTFVATANAVAYCNAVPHFIDSERRTLGVDAEKLARYLEEITVQDGGLCMNKRTGRVLRAVVAMHTFGHPVNLDALAAVCERFHLVLIEDAAESLGSYYKGRHTGSRGRVAALSFNGNKIVTTGGGGAILTQDAVLAAEIRHLTTTAKVPHPWAYEHDRTGYNYRMPNLNAALGCAQLEQLPDLLARKRALARQYAEAFREVPGVQFFEEPSFAQSNYWLNALLLDAPGAAGRDALLAATNEAGFQTRPCWTPMHHLPMYDACPRMDLATAEDLAARLINIPSSPALVSAEETDA